MSMRVFHSMRTGSRRVLLLTAAATAAFGGVAQAQAPAEMSEVVVTGSRLPQSLLSYPGSVSRLDSVAVEEMKAFSSDPAQLLGMKVPGLGTSAPGSASNFEQSLRGRTPAVLIDGVPIGTPLRDGRHDVRSLSLTVLDSVEVIRGASALYGNGGAGGVINYITKKGGDETAFETEIGAQASLTHFGDSFAPFIRQAALGKIGRVDYNFEAYAERTQGQFDAQGDRIRPNPNQQGGLADSQIFNLFGKVGTDFGDQRLEASVLYYSQEQDTDYNRIVNGDVARGIKTRVEKAVPNPRAANEANENFVANLIYSHHDILGSSLRAQVYYQDYLNIFAYDPNDYLGGGQSKIISEKYGARADVNTPFSLGDLVKGGSILWGVDFVNDSTVQGLVDGRAWVPSVTQESLAGFFQIDAPVGEHLTLRGGFRYEDISLENAAFNTLRRQPADVSIPIPAGSRDFTAKVFNVGANYDVTDWASVFVAYSEGFSTAELGRVLRDTRVPLDLSNPALASALAPQTVENYEGGVRLRFDTINVEAVTFKSKCSLCSTTDANLRLVRQPDETFGYELMVDARPSDQTRWGATFTHVDGHQDRDFNGSFETPLPSNRVPPDKLTAFIEQRFGEIWTVRVQGLHSRFRDKFGNQTTSTAVGVAPVAAFTLIDVSVRADLGRRGQVSMAVNNLLNEDYFLIGSYLLNRPDRFSKGPGTTLRLAYTLRY